MTAAVRFRRLAGWFVATNAIALSLGVLAGAPIEAGGHALRQLALLCGLG